MSMFSPNAQDALLDYIGNNCENLYICSSEPTTYTEAQTTYKLGTKSAPTINAAEAGDTSGRKRRIAAFTDGVVDTSGSANWWALTDNSATELLAVGPLAGAPITVTAGNDFSLTDTDFEVQDPS